MNHNISPFEIPDYPPSSGMSELDSLSDSDWLDIASNRGSDDNDSVISGDSDRDEAGFRVPLSRRSSISIGSSREGDVEAWEGFVDDSGDEDAPGLGSTNSPTITADLEATVGGEGLVNSAHDLAEEQRVKAALDQSLISTLSASRSSSTSTHTSLRDLRLSFPDPLTSSHDELHRSYDDVSPSETAFTATDIATDYTTDPADVTMEVPPSSEELDTFTTTPEITQDAMRLHPRGVKKAEFEVVLYGRTSSIKWSFVQELVKKVVATSGRSVIDMSLSTTDNIRLLRLKRQHEEPLFSSEFVPVHDWTDGVAGHMQDPAIEKPSLAIVYLPSLLYALPSHTLYMPVFAPPLGYTAKDDIDAARMIACEDWEALCVPSNKVVNLNKDFTSPVFDGGKTDEIQHLAAHQILQRLITQVRKGSVKSISEHLNSVHAVTLFALMSLIVGFAINTAFRAPPSTPTPTIAASDPSSTFWGMFGPEVNRTAALPTTARANAPVKTTPLEDLSLSVIDPGTTALAITSQDKSLVISATPTVEGGRKSSPQIDKVKLVRDVIIRPSTQLSSIDPKPSVSIVSHAQNAVAGPSTGKSVTGLSLRVVGALSEVLDVKVKTLVKNVQTDLDELVDSLDELARAISRQTQTAIQQSKGKARAIREHVHHRNDKARGKAKELKDRGEKFISSAGKHFKGKTSIAKQRARDLTETFSKSDTWKMYRTAHAEWVVKLKDKGGDRGRVCSRRSSTRCATSCPGGFRRKVSRFHTCV